MNMKRIGTSSLAFAAAIAAVFLVAACEPPPAPTVFEAALYAVDSLSGDVFEIDAEARAASETPLVSTGQNASGEIVFRGGRGYVAVGSYSNTAPGLYSFDPEDPEAGATRIGDAISAQYIAFASNSLAYVSSADYGGTYDDALYSFNPSNPGGGLSLVCALAYPQEIAIGADGRVYVAQNYVDYSGVNPSVMNVARLNAAGNAIETEIDTGADGPTGLLAGTYKGNAGVFVAETGDWTAGAVEFISGTGIAPVVTGPVADALAFLDEDTLIVTGGYPARTYAIDLSAATPAAVELLYDEDAPPGGGESFGGGDAVAVDGAVYVSDGANSVYVIRGDLPVERIEVGGAGAMITNVGAPD